MYRCPTKECQDLGILYSEYWVKGNNADGSLSDTCSVCQQKFVEVNEVEKKRETPMIKTRGCTPSSNPFAH